MSELDQIEYYRHEVLDRTMIIMMQVDQFLISHPYMDMPESGELLKKIEQVSDILGEAYQLIAKTHLQMEVPDGNT